MAEPVEQSGQAPAELPDELDAIVQKFTLGVSGGGGLPADTPDYIGGYFGGMEPAGPAWLQSSLARGGVTLSRDRKAYFEGNEFDVLRAMNTEQLSRFQDALVVNGLVREVMPGRMDDATVAGMEKLMAVGNRQGVTWQEVLDGLVAAGGLGSGSGGAGGFKRGTYLAPDYATLAQTVKDTFRRRLGRDPDDTEMAQLTAELSGWDRQGFDATEAARQSEYSGAGGTVQAIDPVARFQQAFEQKYASELDFVEDKAQAADTQDFMEQTASTVQQAARSTF